MSRRLHHARAAGAAGSIYVLSVYSGYSLEEVAAAATGTLWFQVYLWKDRGVTRELEDAARIDGATPNSTTVASETAAVKRITRASGVKAIGS